MKYYTPCLGACHTLLVCACEWNLTIATLSIIWEYISTFTLAHKWVDSVNTFLLTATIVGVAFISVCTKITSTKTATRNNNYSCTSYTCNITLLVRHRWCVRHTNASLAVSWQFEAWITGAGKGALSIGTDMITIMSSLRTLIYICWKKITL